MNAMDGLKTIGAGLVFALPAMLIIYWAYSGRWISPLPVTELGLRTMGVIAVMAWAVVAMGVGTVIGSWGSVGYVIGWIIVLPAIAVILVSVPLLITVQVFVWPRWAVPWWLDDSDPDFNAGRRTTRGKLREFLEKRGNLTPRPPETNWRVGDWRAERTSKPTARE
jgi:hypothetical protein